MTKYLVTSGESFLVEASSEEEAEAIFHVALGNMVNDDYDFEISDEALNSVEYVEAHTVVEQY